MKNIRQVLLRFNKDYKGNWDKIFDAIKNKVTVTEGDLEPSSNYITLLDNNYPTNLKNGFKPPFVVFYEGDLSLLEKNNLLFISGISKASDKLTELIDTISKKYTLVSYYDSNFDKDILDIAIKNNEKFILVIDKPLHELDKNDEIIKYATINNCLILSEYGFEVDDKEYASIMRHRLIAPFLYGVFVTSSKNTPKSNLLIENVLEKGGNIFVLPEPPFNDSFNNRLIRDGAFIVDSIIDIDKDNT